MLVCNSESRIVAGSKSIANVWIYASFVQISAETKDSETQEVLHSL